MAGGLSHCMKVREGAVKRAEHEEKERGENHNKALLCVGVMKVSIRRVDDWPHCCRKTRTIKMSPSASYDRLSKLPNTSSSLFRPRLH